MLFLLLLHVSIVYADLYRVGKLKQVEKVREVASRNKKA